MRHFCLGDSCGTVTDLVETLLDRCANESDENNRGLLAICIGEVGAIGVHHLEERTCSSRISEKLQRGPWRSRVEAYEFQLLTDHLVAALKAAPSPLDQHKVAYTIQEVLVMLNEASMQDMGFGSVVDQPTGKNEMCPSLSTRLLNAGVLDIIEPFWTTEFREVR